MPKYYQFKVANCFLYFTSKCIVEAMHAHASKDGKLQEHGSAKFFVKGNGDSVATNTGDLNEREIRVIKLFIKERYLEMYEKWSEYSQNGFYNK